jgi:hypothetical protein
VNTGVPADSVHGHELVDQIVSGVVTSVEEEMRGKQASMVLEILEATLARRLPGIVVDGEAMRLAAARIGAGLPATPEPVPVAAGHMPQDPSAAVV